jgi:septin family protein
MKELHELVNIIPVIAKADTLMPKEIKELKKKVFREIQDHGIQIFVPDLFEDDEASNTEVKEIRTGIPFAVVGSNTLLEVNGKKVRGRIYPWGVVEVENKKHSDFVLLRDMMMKTHMQDLKDITQDIHYENFRKKKLTDGEGMSPYLGARRTPEVTTTDGNENPDLLKEQLRMMQAEMERLKAALGKEGEEAAV